MPATGWTSGGRRSTSEPTPSSPRCDQCSCLARWLATTERILLFGASGFVGRHVLGALTASGTAEMIAVARHQRIGEGRVTWVAGDLAEPSLARSLLAKLQPHVIINCAGVTVGSADSMDRGNVAVVRNALEAMQEAAEVPRLVHLGSAVEYGAVEPGAPISETSPIRPEGPYGESKAAATALALGSPVANRVTVLRLFNVVGDGAPRSSLLGSAVEKIRAAQAASESEIRLGDLSAFRDFVHVADVADAVVTSAAASEVGRVVVNVGSGKATQTRDLVRTLAEVAGFDGEIIEVDPGGPHGGHVTWQQADISRAAELLGWRPIRSLADAVRDAWKASGSG